MMNFEEINGQGLVEGFCLVKNLEVKKTAKGVPFLDIVLTDSSGEISAKLWDYKEEIHSCIKQDALLKVRGTLSVFNDAPQLRVERVRAVIDSDGVRVEDFVPSSDIEGERMLAEILKVVSQFKNEQLRKLTETVIERKREKILFWPAAFKLHHAIRGGLLYHTLSILRLAQSVSDIYPSVNKDLLYTGVILHDVSKIDEFVVSETGVASGYSAEGQLLGHLVMGAMNIEKTGTELGIDKELLMLVEHMVISHHGEPEFGAAVRPMFLEAEILSILDLLDARIYESEQVISETGNGEFSQKLWFLDNVRLYNPGLNDVDTKANLI